MSIDTLRLKFIEPGFIPGKWEKTTKDHGDGTTEIFYTMNIDQYGIHCSYYPISRRKDHKPMLVIQINSVPRLLYGNNYQLLPSIRIAIEIVESVLSTIPEIAGLNLDISSGIIDRIDCVCNYVVDNPYEYLNYIANKIYPHRKRSDLRNSPNIGDTWNGVEFISDNIRSIFYHKEKQSHNSRAIGILRHEVQITGPYQLKKYFGSEEPQIGSITEDQLRAPLLDDLRVLGLDQDIAIASSDFSEIFQKLPGQQGLALLGFAVAREHFVSQPIRPLGELLGLSDAQTRRYLRKERKHNFSYGRSGNYIIPAITPCK